MNEVTLTVPAEIFEVLTTRAQRRGIGVNQLIENMLSETRDLIDDFPDEELATPEEIRVHLDTMAARIADRTPDQIKADQERIFQTLRKGREYLGGRTPQTRSEPSLLGVETGEGRNSAKEERS